MTGDSSVLDKTAIITGATKDLADAAVIALAQNGFRVVVGTTDTAGHAEPTAVVRGAITAPIDVTSENSVRAFVDGITQASALIIVNGPRRSHSRKDADTNDGHWRWETNVLGAVRLTRALIPRLDAAPDPVIVVISAADEPNPENLASDRTDPDFEVRTLHRLLEAEIRGTAVRLGKIRCSATYPGLPPEMSTAIAEVISYQITGPTNLVIEEVSIRPWPHASTTRTGKTLT